jgi:hypothetical protein
MLLTSFKKASISLLSQTGSSIHLSKLLQLSLRDIIIIIIVIIIIIIIIIIITIINL